MLMGDHFIPSLDRRSGRHILNHMSASGTPLPSHVPTATQVPTPVPVMAAASPPAGNAPTAVAPASHGPSGNPGGGTSPKSDFMAAEEIKSILGSREKPEQARILRWVTESLGIALVPSASPSHLTTGQVAATDTPTPLAGQHHVVATRAANIKSFTDIKQPKSDMQFAAVVAYYYAFEAPEEQRKESITGSDLNEAARHSGRKRYSNPGVPLNNAMAQGYLDRAGSGQFRLNAVGENLVAMALPGSPGDGSQNGARRAKKKQIKKTSRKPKAS
ncbi:MAG: hypothetical protein JWR26_4065 [Pedosphaera sp.]|nr:hypothetical protein [Pedosphaera sp.]